MHTELPQRTIADALSYEDLYSRWEKGNWRSTEIDFSEDARQWREEFSELERKAALWNYALFFWGEDAVADGLSPYIEAAPREEQKYFLATQQVDEARHAVFFSRFMHEVCGVEGDTTGERLAAIKPQLSWGFRKVFERLERMSDELRADPSLPRLAAAVALYHVVIESTLAQPGQHFITSYLEERDLLPGFRAGMERVAADEQRHIGFGVKLLADLAREDPACKGAVADLLRRGRALERGCAGAAQLGPPLHRVLRLHARGDRCGGERLRWRPSCAAPACRWRSCPARRSSPRECRSRSGPRTRCASSGRASSARRRARPSATRRRWPPCFGWSRAAWATDEAPPGILQWEFPDADPWHLVVANGESRVEPGRAPGAPATLRLR